MMKIKTVDHFSSRKPADALVLPFWIASKELSPAYKKYAGISKKAFSPIELGDFKAHLGESCVVYPNLSKGEARYILLGLGAQEDLTVENLRKAFASLVHFCQKQKISKLSVLIPEIKAFSKEELCQGVSEGLHLSNYVFDRLKQTSSKSKIITQCQLIGLGSKEQTILDKSHKLCSGVNLARDLVNENADTMNADKLAGIARGLSSSYPKIKTEIFDKKRLEKEKLKLILAVNRGSNVQPCLIMVKYMGKPSDKEATVLVGKGITYDTGGIQLKPSQGSIVHMKADMGGAAAVLGILQTAAELDLPLNVVGVIPACENAISNTAYKPGDVYDSYFGKSVEIANTDAEGRLVLADALAYAEKNLKPKHMIDLATLTGGAKAALGDQISALMSNNPKLAKRLLYSGKKSGDNLWELPLYEQYKQGLKSKIADLKNSAQPGTYPTAVIAGLFLQEFVKSTPWAHLDIAGTAYLSESKDYHPTKATGVGVRLILAFLEELIESQGEY